MRLHPIFIALPLILAGNVARADETPETYDHLERRVRRLARVLKGQTSLDVPIRTLFGVDLDDPKAIKARVERLNDQIVEASSSLPLVATSSTSTSAVEVGLRRPILDFRAAVLELELLSLPTDVLAERVRGAEAKYEARLAAAESRAEAERAAAAAQRAEGQRRAALADAERARTQKLKALKGLRARVAQSMSALADRAEKLSKDRQVRNALEAEVVAKATKHIAASQGTISATAADSMYETSIILVDRALEELEVSMSLATESLKLGELDVEPPDTDTDASPEERQAAFEVRESIVEFERYREEIRTTERTSRADDIVQWLAEVEALMASRERVLLAMSPDDRSERFAYSKVGLTEARREISALRLTTQARIVARAQSIARLDFTDFSNLGRWATTILKLLVIFFAAYWLRRKSVPRLRKWLAVHRPDRVQSMVSLRRVTVLQRAVERFASPVIFIFALHAGRWWLGGFGDFLELELAFTVVVWFSYYWLIRVAANSAILALARRRQIAVRPDLRAKIERTTLHAGRAAFVFGMFLSLAHNILGRGVLAHHGERFLTLGVVVVGFLLVRSWRTEIAATYLRFRPEGTLARLVDQSKDKYYSFVVVLAAFFLVAVRGIVAVAKETALQFDQIRKALSFLFRKRLERRGEELGQFKGDVERLPLALKDAFSTQPLTDSDVRVDFCPGLDKLQADLDAWNEGRMRGSFLVRAPRGYGKTTWLWRAAEAARSYGVPVEHVALSRRDDGRDCLLHHLGRITGADEPDDIIEKLRDARRIILLDDIHRLVVRDLGGYDGFDLLLDVMERTADRVFWIAAADDTAWRYISAARPRRVRFRSEQFIREWSEQDIRMLLMARAAASGVVHQFDDLLADSNESDNTTALARSSEAYTRLIWDYADGCPAVACHFWLRSLAYVADDRVRVRLFSSPRGERLDRAPPEVRFAYAALATHDRLSATQLARVLRMDPQLAAATLTRGVEEGILEPVADSDQFEIGVHWYRSVMRHLSQHNMI